MQQQVQFGVMQSKGNQDAAVCNVSLHAFRKMVVI